MIVVRHVSSALLHPHDQRIDHLHRRSLTGRQCIHDPVAVAGLPSTDLQPEKTEDWYFRDYPCNRTYPGHAKIDANDPQRTSTGRSKRFGGALLSMRPVTAIITENFTNKSSLKSFRDPLSSLVQAAKEIQVS